uniref:Uncharacterized protein n=1 Tax=Anguilla anguilla TaxID=7936 RepID=A0A0E9TLB6_ANGAN
MSIPVVETTLTTLQNHILGPGTELPGGSLSTFISSQL